MKLLFIWAVVFAVYLTVTFFLAWAIGIFFKNQRRYYDEITEYRYDSEGEM